MINIYNSALKLLAGIDEYSIDFGVNYYKPVQFELTINDAVKRKHDIEAGEEVFKKGNIVVFGFRFDKSLCIMHREAEFDEGGKATENWTIKGYSLSKITSQRRIITPAMLDGTASHDSFTGDAESAMHHYIYNHLVNPEQEHRKVDKLKLGTNNNRGVERTWEFRFDRLDEALEKIARIAGLGWRITVNPDNEEYIFECYEGQDLTEGNTESNSPVIFSPDFDTLQRQGFIDSNMEYRNLVYVAGQGEGTERMIKVVPDENEPEGLQLFEEFIDARNIETEEGLTNRGEDELEEKGQERRLESEILAKSPFKYEEDYNIGDMVTVQNKDWDITMNARLVEMREMYNEDGKHLSATFGDKIPTVFDEIKKDIDSIPEAENPTTIDGGSADD